MFVFQRTALALEGVLIDTTSNEDGIFSPDVYLQKLQSRQLGERIVRYIIELIGAQ